MTAIPRQDPSRPKAKSRPASAAMPRHSGQPAPTAHAAPAGAYPGMPQPAAAAGSLPTDTQAMLPAQGLPFPASTGNQGSPMSLNMKLPALQQLPHGHDTATLPQVQAHSIYTKQGRPNAGMTTQCPRSCSRSTHSARAHNILKLNCLS